MLKFLKDYKDYFFLFIITILFAYIMGLTIISVINKRLTDISINVPTPQVNLQWPEGASYPTKENEDSQPVHENFTNPSTNLNLQNDNLRGFESQKDYYDCSEATNQVQQEKMDSMNRVCCSKHQHNKYLCSYGKTNYLDPQELDPINRRLYQYNYFPNMTLQDYINWLWLYQNQPEKLCYEHFRNLQKLQKGTPLRYEKGICPPKMNAQGSFSYAKDGTHDLGTFFTETMKYVGLGTK